MLFQTIYYEQEIKEHPETERLFRRFSDIPHVPIHHYGEVFNRKGQNFRLQKQSPSLILGKKRGKFVLPTPEGYGIGGTNNYYFSHMFNCIYDCRYCFLQGMYNSANYVLFVNFQDFENEIIRCIERHKEDSAYFFSGYDCDSLALESITGFAKRQLSLFSNYSQAYLELRTKSTNIQFLLDSKPLNNCIVAFTLSPKSIVNALEHKTPSLTKRLEAIDKLQKKGWTIGLRFDPIIYSDGYQDIYHNFFSEVFDTVSIDHVHSVTTGSFRVPKHMFKKMVKLYPREKLFSHSLIEKNSQITYNKEILHEMGTFIAKEIAHFTPQEKIFSCEIAL